MESARRHITDQKRVLPQEDERTRHLRLERERALLQVARTQLEAGEGIGGEDLDAFLDALDGEVEPTIPARRSVR